MAEGSDGITRNSGPHVARRHRAEPVFAVVAVLLGSFLANFDSRLTSVGLPDLRGAFSLGFDEGAWLSTAAIGSQISSHRRWPGLPLCSASVASSEFRAWSMRWFRW